MVVDPENFRSVTFLSLLAKYILSSIACLKAMSCGLKTLTTFLSFSGEYISCISARVIRISVEYVLVNFSLKNEHRVYQG